MFKSIKSFHSFCCFIVFMWVQPFAICQTPALKEFNISDGLPSSHIYQTIQDKDGFIWVATDKGVSKYDGYSFENFTVKDGLPSNDVWGLEEDSKGRIWLNTVNRLVYIKKDKVYSIESDSINLEGVSLSHIITEENHFLKISSPALSINKISKDLKLSAPLDPSLWDHIRNHVFIYESNQASVLSSDWRFPDEKQVLQRLILSNISQYCKSVLINDSQIIFNFQDSILRYSNGNLDRLNINIDHIKNQKKVSIKNSDYYLLESSDYTYWLDKNLNVLPDLHLEPNLNINTASFDRHNNLWISTNDGLFLLSKNAFESKSYVSINGNPLELYSINKDNLDRIWMGGNNSLFYQFKRDGKHIQYSASDIFKKPISGIDFDGYWGMFLSGFYNYYIPKNKQSGYPNPSNKILTVTFPTSKDNSKTPLINTKSILFMNESFFICHGITLSELSWSKNKIEIVSKRNLKKTFALEANSSNELCLGQSGGIFFLKSDSIVKPEMKHPVFNLPIVDLKYDKNDYLWIATQGQGLFRFANNQIDTINELLDQNLNKIKIYNGDIWISNSSGIHEIKIESEWPLKYYYKKYNRSHGMVSNEANDFIVSDSLIYTASKRGLSVIKRSYENEAIDSNLLLISGLSINDRDTLLLDNYFLNYNENNIRIDFVWLSFVEDKNVVYSYMLEGEDSSWKTTNNIFKEYSNLSPGKYKFKIRAQDISQNPLSIEKCISFNINKPWWFTNLSIVLFAFLLFLVLYITYFFLIKRAKHQAEKKNQLNKKFAQLELNALQAQMNPHFIFNALNSIQDFIFNKDGRTANKYLVKFSRLMRLFLDSSKEKDILFSEEIKLLKLYMELEELRFENKFTSQVLVDDKIAQNNVKIPSMMLQPFVENAINHGLRYKERDGELKITFHKKENRILCIIEDNGIGRDKAEKLKNQKTQSYKSRGMNLVNERKNIFNLMQQSNIEIEYVDIVDKSNNALGTKVEISLPNIIYQD